MGDWGRCCRGGQGGGRASPGRVRRHARGMWQPERDGCGGAVSGEMRSNVQALRGRGGPRGRRERLWEGGQPVAGSAFRVLPGGAAPARGAHSPEKVPPPSCRLQRSRDRPGTREQPSCGHRTNTVGPRCWSGWQPPGQPGSAQNRDFPGPSSSPPGLRGREGPKAVHLEPRKHRGSRVFLRRHRLTSVP